MQAETNLKAQKAVVQSLKDQVSAAEADLNTAIANTHQAHAAQSTVESTRGQLANAEDSSRKPKFAWATPKSMRRSLARSPCAPPAREKC